MQLCITGEMNKRGPVPDPACSDRGPSVFMRGLMHHGIRSRNGVARRGAPRARGGLGSHVERSSPGVMQLCITGEMNRRGPVPHPARSDRGPRGLMHHGIRPRDGVARRAAQGRAAISEPPPDTRGCRPDARGPALHHGEAVPGRPSRGHSPRQRPCPRRRVLSRALQRAYLGLPKTLG